MENEKWTTQHRNMYSSATSTVTPRPCWALLDQLGWKQRDRGPGGQRLVFVGDLIDRGPQNLRTVEIVRELVERGRRPVPDGQPRIQCRAVPLPLIRKNPGQTLRPQNPKNRKQHQAVLDEIEHRPGDWQDMLAWFRTLPLAVEGKGWRCVHACWHPPSLEILVKRDGGWFLTEDAWLAAATEGNPYYEAAE